MGSIPRFFEITFLDSSNSRKFEAKDLKRYLGYFLMICKQNYLNKDLTNYREAFFVLQGILKEILGYPSNLLSIAFITNNNYSLDSSEESREDLEELKQLIKEMKELIIELKDKYKEKLIALNSELFLNAFKHRDDNPSDKLNTMILALENGIDFSKIKIHELAFMDQTPLEWAQNENKAELIALLLENGADFINSEQLKILKFLKYFSKNDLNKAQKILESKLDLHKIQTYKKTLLHDVVSSLDIKKFIFLLENGINLNAKNESGKTAFQVFISKLDEFFITDFKLAAVISILDLFLSKDINLKDLNDEERDAYENAIDRIIPVKRKILKANKDTILRAYRNHRKSFENKNVTFEEKKMLVEKMRLISKLIHSSTTAAVVNKDGEFLEEYRKLDVKLYPKMGNILNSLIINDMPFKSLSGESQQNLAMAILDKLKLEVGLANCMTQAMFLYHLIMIDSSVSNKLKNQVKICALSCEDHCFLAVGDLEDEECINASTGLA